MLNYERWRVAESLFSQIESTSEQPDKYVDISVILELFEKMECTNLGLANDSLFSMRTKIKFCAPETAIVTATQTFSDEKPSKEHSVSSMSEQFLRGHGSDFVAISFSSLKPTSRQSFINTHNIEKY